MQNKAFNDSVRQCMPDTILSILAITSFGHAFLDWESRHIALATLLTIAFRFLLRTMGVV